MCHHMRPNTPPPHLPIRTARPVRPPARLHLTLPVLVHFFVIILILEYGCTAVGSDRPYPDQPARGQPARQPEASERPARGQPEARSGPGPPRLARGNGESGGSYHVVHYYRARHFRPPTTPTHPPTLLTSLGQTFAQGSRKETRRQCHCGQRSLRATWDRRFCCVLPWPCAASCTGLVRDG